MDKLVVWLTSAGVIVLIFAPIALWVARQEWRKTLLVDFDLPEMTEGERKNLLDNYEPGIDTASHCGCGEAWALIGDKDGVPAKYCTNCNRKVDYDWV